MKNISSLFFVLVFCLRAQAQTIMSPAEFLGYELGEKFTYHHQVVAYFKHITDQSSNVTYIPYGQTTEGRELAVVVLSDEQNMQDLDQLRLTNLQKTGLSEGTAEGSQIPIVWLSYNIHGNEAVSSEAAMKTLHTLVTRDTGAWLKDMIVVMDPCVNPDGRDRYVNWYKQAVNAIPNVLPESYEHNEPWPGGRFNHYLFDLNRDWCWQTQIETQQRIRLYHQWMPHVHVDFHEMGANSPYFFGPAARPYHEIITDWQREFQELTGRNHARYFDKNGWLYFTKETYDLLYPSYGDTWPTYQGAIGFTYEQGGSGRAGLAYQTGIGDTLTLKDRIAHHYTTGLSTVETAFTNRQRLLQEFNDYFSRARQSPAGTYKSYIIKGDQEPSRIQALLQLLDKNQIQYGYQPSGKRSYRGFDYDQGKESSFEIRDTDIIISAYQPQSNLVKVLFEPETQVEDSITYDLTAWTIPYAYGLSCIATTERVDFRQPGAPAVSVSIPEAGSPPYAYLAEWKDMQDVTFLSELLTAGIKVRYAERPFTLKGVIYDRGTLIITRTDNSRPDFAQTVTRIAQQHQQSLTPAYTGFMDDGKDFGSRYVRFIRKPRIALVNGSGVSTAGFGEMWHYLEQQLKYPVTVINTSYLGNVDLDTYDVLILASGSYRRFSGQILTYVRNGGKVIAIERAISIFATTEEDQRPPSLLAKAFQEKRETDDRNLEEEKKSQQPEELLNRYEDRTRSRLSNFVAGSIYKVSLDDSHPLAFGEDQIVHLIKRNSTVYPYLPEGGWNVGSYQSDKSVNGFTGSKLQEKIAQSLAIGTESIGRGQVIYFVDSPIFRGFWHSGKLLLGNAIFF